MVIDQRRCIGCHSCTVACRTWNKLPLDIVYNPVVTEGAQGTWPNVHKSWQPLLCMHCENPECVPCCPSGASQQDEDGTVWVDPKKCLSCKVCVNACPYGCLLYTSGLRQAVDGAAPEDAFALASQAFAARAAALQERAAGVEQRLARAFAFVEASFGDAQEMVVFTTELTSRTSSARYIAQYGSQSYFAHNQDMILSDRQRELRRRVEDLDV